MTCRVQKLPALELTVDLDEHFAHSPQQRPADRFIVDECARPAVVGQNAAKNKRTLVVVDLMLGQNTAGAMVGRDRESGADAGLGCAMTDEACIRAGAKGESQRIEKDGFSGAGLTGQSAEPRPELQLKAIDQ